MHRGIVRAWAVVAALVLAGGVAGSAPPAGAQEQPVITASGTLLPGIYSSQWKSYLDLTGLADRVGKQVTFSGTFHNAVKEPAWITDWILEQSWQAQTTPVANMTIPATAATIAAGLYDADIERWAGQVRSWLARGEGRSVFIAPFQEMNGTWTPYGGDPVHIRIAFRKVVDTFRTMGMDETQVRFVFAPNSTSTRYRMVDYYPGGTYVDVVGMSAYNFGPSLDRWTTVPETFDAGLAELSRIAPTKPILITQVGASPIDGSQPFWLADMFRALTADPRVVGFVYFNFDKETDWRIWTGITVSDGWRAGMDLASTHHTWPLTDWFLPGPIPFSVDGSAPSGWFVDDDGSPFEPDIEWLAERRITNGCNPPVEDRFCPDDPVTRGQMASFLARAFDLPTADGDRFTDDAGSVHEYDINRLSVAGITLGCGGDLFCPSDIVDRGSMAAFLVRALGLPVSTTDHFTDDDGSPYEWAINALADSAITSGCSPTTYCPESPITRGQMARLLTRALGT